MNYNKIPAMNWSTLKLMANPREFKWAVDHPGDDRDSPAMLLGRAIHCMVLEPDEFEARYFTPEKKQCESTLKNGKRCSRNAVPGALLCRQHGGEETADDREVLTPSAMATVVAAAGAVAANPDACRLLEGCETEVTAQWEVEGVKCKGRLDAVSPKRIVDLKTTRGLDWFEQDAARMLYHGQLAWYRDGWVQHNAPPLPSDKWLAPDSYIIAVETSEPWDVGVFYLPESIELSDGRHVDGPLAAGRRLYTDYLHTYLACREMDTWPGRFPGVTDLRLPRWAPGMEEEEGY